jgi:polysaccharide export outer membrane protein
MLRRPLLAFFLLALSGCPQQQPLASASDIASESRPPVATVGPGDLLSVRVVGEESLSGAYRVSPDGAISFPYLREIPVAGLLPGEIQEKIAEGLRDGYLRDPQVVVDVQESNANKVYVFGYVKTPGTFRYKDHMSVVEALTLAGGPTPDGDANQTTITRLRDGVEVTYTVPVNNIVKGQARNVELLPGDILNVPLRKW